MRASDRERDSTVLGVMVDVATSPHTTDGMNQARNRTNGSGKERRAHTAAHTPHAASLGARGPDPAEVDRAVDHIHWFLHTS